MEWQGIVTVTAPQYFAGAADSTIRKRLLLKLLESRGRIKFNETGTVNYWDVQYREHPMEPYGDAGSIVYQREDLYRQLTTDWRGYVMTDMMTEKERLMNDGDLAIINRYDRILPNMQKALTHRFSGELYTNGYAAGNNNRLHGVESFLASTGSPTAADRIVQASQAYGGLTTAVGNGGTWSALLSTYPNAGLATDWPDGSGDVEYDFMTPKLVNWSSNNWGTNSTLWEDNCERALRQANIWLQTTCGEDGMPTIYLLAGNLFYPYMNKQESKMRIIVPHKEADDLGFPMVLNQEGVMIKNEFDVPVNSGYALNIDQMELASLDSQLFGTRGPQYDIKTDAYLFKAGFFGNARWNPKYFAKFSNYA